MSKKQFATLLHERGITLSAKQEEQFQLYFKLLVEWNEKMNLTAITEEDDVYLKHFYDSITASFYYPFKAGQRLLDVGAGAGFPSIPLKIIHPELHVSIVDSLNKRIGFLTHLANELKLDGVAFYHDRAETFGQNKDHREQYDIVTARAVARLSVLSELCLPLVKIKGDFIAMKAAGTADEVVDANKAIQILGGKVISDDSFVLPIEESERHIITIQKEKTTPKKYPRKPGTPNKTPL
ncbi:16S rRNA (guanine(527)-N(7))-methyltransferase RsmG [Halalkalibacter akibai]|uniref:Ribosomal RNA small subunit methyltransferase G n=1 Tax=Halalkalibacter akibai (strain ATCC 43226 / DSM 21942 / CIP 109018 / JCM 9157 / 1139) TaxID=1236973 RepID=W4QQQ3_HALA3|nr:16S rRNA (guanine(527)-N(7))-methyltransferase RsmG [Halalkalibacter akibai]GAE34415.1 rRNA small subunit 7-methylguanosine (m7G) methyltransferase GidB [Halalkalibacter akibai JCM 9157]